MAVPEEIRRVPRPKNTIVFVYGKNKDRYGVKTRVGCVRKGGSNVPVDGPVVGHIVNGEYVPCGPERISQSDTDYRRWADVALCDALSRDLLADLREVYSAPDAMKTYAIALLRAIEPGVTDGGLKEEYEDTFLSIMYPGIPLSKNTVGDHIRDLGRTCSRITAFMHLRAGRVGADHLIAVDSTLKRDESEVNTFSEFSRKSGSTGERCMSVVYAYDVETGEPVCCKAYPGNTADVSVMGDFVRTQGVTRGVILSDKGFSYAAARGVFLDNPGLHFLMALKRDAAVIRQHRMYDYDSSVPGRGGLACRKERMADGRFLYSFRDPYTASREEAAWVKRHGGGYDPAELAGLRKEFGSIVFVSDIDMGCGAAYAAYERRWEIEAMFRLYKGVLEFDKTGVHSDFSVMGSEFVNFVSVLMRGRMERALSGAKSLEGVSMRGALRLLERATKIRGPDGEWLLRKVTVRTSDALVELGLLPRPEVAKRPRGRPRKNPPA